MGRTRSPTRISTPPRPRKSTRPTDSFSSTRWRMMLASQPPRTIMSFMSSRRRSLVPAAIWTRTLPEPSSRTAVIDEVKFCGARRLPSASSAPEEAPALPPRSIWSRSSTFSSWSERLVSTATWRRPSSSLIRSVSSISRRAMSSVLLRRSEISSDWALLTSA